jgi:hypothetical protein
MKDEDLRDIHIRIDQETLARVRRLCLHKGDLTWHLQQSVKQYLEKMEAHKEDSYAGA